MNGEGIERRSGLTGKKLASVVTASLMCAIISHGGINFVYWRIGRRECARNGRNAKNCIECNARRLSRAFSLEDREFPLAGNARNARKFENVVSKFSALP